MSISMYAPTWYVKDVPFTTQNEDRFALTNLGSAKQWSKVLDDIQRYGTYGDNWDGMGSDSPALQTISIAAEFLKAVRAAGAMPPKLATLAPDGCVLVEWWSGGNVLQAEFSAEQKIEFVEFGPNMKPGHWSLDVNRNTGSMTWDANMMPTEGAAAFASAA